MYSYIDMLWNHDLAAQHFNLLKVCSLKNIRIFNLNWVNFYFSYKFCFFSCNTIILYKVYSFFHLEQLKFNIEHKYCVSSLIRKNCGDKALNIIDLVKRNLLQNKNKYSKLIFSSFLTIFFF